MNKFPSTELPKNLNLKINIRGQIPPNKTKRGNFGDGIILATAVEGKFTVITQDKGVLETAPKFGVDTVTPKTLLEGLKNEVSTA